MRRHLAQRIAALPDVTNVAIVADARVADLHAEKLLSALQRDAPLFTVPPGEASKSLDAAATLYDRLAQARIERSDLILTFGGGVVGDLAGFVAATWLRGIRFIQVPTTIEAAVDAAVGGKTGLNLPAGKNLIGAFHQPSAVVIDIEFLETLPDRDFSAGLAESVKHGAIRDESFLDWQAANAAAIGQRDDTVLVDLIARNCEIKADVVAKDERERNLRAILNHGHTIGHAIEHLFDYERRHGECVALGMIAENEIACRRGMLERAPADRLKTLLERLGLATRLPRALAPEEILAATRMDKKVRAGVVNYVLLRGLGDPVRTADVTDAEVVSALETIQP